VSISAPGSAASVQLPGGGLNVTTNHPVLLNGPQTKAFLTGLTRQITGGSALTIVLHFQQAGAVTVKGVPVMARAAHFVTYGPAPSPSATGTTTARKKHHASATPTPTPSAS